MPEVRITSWAVVRLTVLVEHGERRNFMSRARLAVQGHDSTVACEPVCHGQHAAAGVREPGVELVPKRFPVDRLAAGAGARRISTLRMDH